MQDDNEDEFRTTLRRIKRNHEDLLLKYDKGIILDLICSLRLLTELKSWIREKHQDFSTQNIFKTAKPVKSYINSLKGKIFIITFMPDGLVTSAFNPSQSLIAAKRHGDDDFTLESSFMIRSDGLKEFKDFVFIKDSDDLPNSTPNLRKQISKCNFHVWLESEIVKLSVIDNNKKFNVYSLNRIDLIQRIAVNGAVHPRQKNDESYNRSKDALIENLFSFSCGGLPLHYFLLVKMSQDILNAADKTIVRNF